MARYKVHTGYTASGQDRWEYFATLPEATAFCSLVFARRKVVLSIISVAKEN